MKKILLTAVLLFISTQLLAQGPPAPPPAPSSAIPWGNPAIYVGVIVSYLGYRKHLLKGK